MNQTQNIQNKILGITRISLGFIFLWAFAAKAPMWLAGGLPAQGFLANATRGPFVELFVMSAGNPIINFLYMFGLFSVGTALMLGIARKLATLGGILMMALIYLSAFPPANNPLIDEHVIYILILLYMFYKEESYKYLGNYEFWKKLSVVKKFKILE